MIRKTVLSLIGITAFSLAMSGPLSPLDRFVADKEFCAYMASPPENDSEEFLARYATAMRAAISFIRQENPGTTDTQAILSIKAKCDVVLREMSHYR